MPRARASHRPGRMNLLESDYALGLAVRKAAGEIADFWFECYKLRLADRTWYTPDFLVQHADGTLDMVEVKAWWKGARRVGWTDDSRVKWKTCAEMYPLFGWVATWKRDGRWLTETYGKG